MTENACEVQTELASATPLPSPLQDEVDGRSFSSSNGSDLDVTQQSDTRSSAEGANDIAEKGKIAKKSGNTKENDEPATGKDLRRKSQLLTGAASKWLGNTAKRIHSSRFVCPDGRDIIGTDLELTKEKLDTNMVSKQRLEDDLLAEGLCLSAGAVEQTDPRLDIDCILEMNIETVRSILQERGFGALRRHNIASRLIEEKRRREDADMKFDNTLYQRKSQFYQSKIQSWIDTERERVAIEKAEIAEQAELKRLAIEHQQQQELEAEKLAEVKRISEREQQRRERMRKRSASKNQDILAAGRANNSIEKILQEDSVLALQYFVDDLDKGVDAVDKYRRPILISAALANSVQCFEWLLENGADPSATDDVKNTALHFASANGHTLLVKDLIKSEHIAIDAQAFSGNTSLHLAALNGHLHVVQELLKAGAPINKANSVDMTALHCAAFRGQHAVVRTLLMSGADIMATEAKGASALHLAAQSGDADCVQELIDRGAVISGRNIEGMTPEDLASTAEIKSILRG